MDDDTWAEVVATARGVILAAGRGDGEGAHVLLPLPDPDASRVVGVLAGLTHRLLEAEADRRQVTVGRLLDGIQRVLLRPTDEGTS